MMKSLRFLTFALIGALAIAACDEGEDTTATAVEGTIRGAVTIEGSGASGVTVTLSSGASTTTDGSGNYTFSNVPAGSYVVQISGTPADATFASTAGTAVIATAGQVVTVDFSGSFVRTSAIVGGVAVEGVGPLENVSVTLSGDASASTSTDAAGQYSFTGLRAGSYTVTISGFDAVQYTFPSDVAERFRRRRSHRSGELLRFAGGDRRRSAVRSSSTRTTRTTSLRRRGARRAAHGAANVAISAEGA